MGCLPFDLLITMPGSLNISVEKRSSFGIFTDTLSLTLKSCTLIRFDLEYFIVKKLAFLCNFDIVSSLKYFLLGLVGYDCVATSAGGMVVASAVVNVVVIMGGSSVTDVSGVVVVVDDGG